MGRFANARDEVNNALQGSTRGKGAFAGALNGRAVRKRIAERDAEFDDVGASLQPVPEHIRREASSDGSPAVRNATIPSSPDARSSAKRREIRVELCGAAVICFAKD